MIDLKDLTSKGIICGPYETANDFENRVSFLTHIKEHLPLIALHLKTEEPLYLQTMKVESLDLYVDWLITQNSSKELLFWEAAAAWSFEIDRVSLSLIRYKKNSSISPQELLKHELIHAIRSSFPDSIYEEVLAYQVSSSCFRRFFGPLFHSAKETLFFLLSSLLPLIGFIKPELFPSLTLAFCFISTCFLVRLCVYQLLFHRALATIKRLFLTSSPLKIALHLTYKEMLFFSYAQKETIKKFISKQKDLRWKQILFSYDFID